MPGLHAIASRQKLHVPWLGQASDMSLVRLHSGHLDRVPFFSLFLHCCIDPEQDLKRLPRLRPSFEH